MNDIDITYWSNPQNLLKEVLRLSHIVRARAGIPSHLAWIDEPEDHAQDVILKFMEVGYPKLVAGKLENPRAYLAKSLYNKLVDECKRSKHAPKLLDDVEQFCEREKSEVPYSWMDLHSLKASLPPVQKTVLSFFITNRLVPGRRDNWKAAICLNMSRNTLTQNVRRISEKAQSVSVKVQSESNNTDDTTLNKRPIEQLLSFTMAAFADWFNGGRSFNYDLSLQNVQEGHMMINTMEYVFWGLAWSTGSIEASNPSPDCLREGWRRFRELSQFAIYNSRCLREPIFELLALSALWEGDKRYFDSEDPRVLYQLSEFQTQYVCNSAPIWPTNFHL